MGQWKLDSRLRGNDRVPAGGLRSDRQPADANPLVFDDDDCARIQFCFRRNQRVLQTLPDLVRAGVLYTEQDDAGSMGFGKGDDLAKIEIKSQQDSPLRRGFCEYVGVG